MNYSETEANIVNNYLRACKYVENILKNPPIKPLEPMDSINEPNQRELDGIFDYQSYIAKKEVTLIALNTITQIEDYALNNYGSIDNLLARVNE